MVANWVEDSGPLAGGGHLEILKRETPSSIGSGIAMAQAGRDDQGPVLAAACRCGEGCYPCWFSNRAKSPLTLESTEAFQ